MNLGIGIRQTRKAQNISQLELAKLVRISQTSLSLMEGGTTHPRPATMKRIAAVLKVPESVLYLSAVMPEDMPEAKRYNTLFARDLLLLLLKP